MVIEVPERPPAARGPLSAAARRVAARFAEVACPPGIRAEQRTQRVVAELELMLAAMPRAARGALSAALLALDNGARLYPPARGRRFARLDDQRADAYLRALLARRGGMAAAARRLRGLVALCYYALPDVQEQVGYRPGPYIAAVSRRRLASYAAEIRAGEAAVLAPEPSGRAATLSGSVPQPSGRPSRPAEPAPKPSARTTTRSGSVPQPAGRAARPAGLTTQDDVTGSLRVECGVVIVGSGAGGATMAAELADAGVDVVMIEEGGYHPTESFTAEASRALRTLYRDGGGGIALGRPSVLFAEGRCVGGSTVVNGGMSWRTPPRVLARWAADGVTGLSEQELEPYFARAEARLSVAPQDPETIGRDSRLLKAGADAMGWTVVANQRNQLHCAGTNNCNNGCPTGAKRSMLVTSVPRALSRGARLFADCRVDRITRSGTAVTGVSGRFLRPGGRPGPALTVRARVVIVAGGAVQTPALLARSGLRSASGQLGRNLALHPNATVTASFDEDVTGWHGVHQAFQVREFMAEGIVITAVNLPPPLLAASVRPHGRELGELMADYNRVVTAGPLIEDSGAGRVRAVPGLGVQVFYQLSDWDAARVVRGVQLTAEALFAAGARRVLLPFDGAPDVRDPAGLRRLLTRPVPRRSMELYSIHLMGTARMSEDPRRGVTGSFGAFHGVPGLFVSDASLFPGPAGINPMETVIALALRNARRLIERRDRYGI